MTLIKYNFMESVTSNEPFVNAIALAELPVTIIYKYVKNLVVDEEEDGTEITYTGYVMETLPNQKFLAKDYKHLKIIGHCDDTT